MNLSSPHRQPEVEDLVDRAYDVLDDHSAIDVALFVGRASGKSVDELAQQISDQSGRRGQNEPVKQEIHRRVQNVEEDLRSALIEGDFDA